MMWYFIVGLVYWAINIFVRKLHEKNEHGEGWFLVPFWVFLWPICMILLVASAFSVEKKEEHPKF